MVQIMTGKYNRLAAADQDRTYMLAVGLEIASFDDQQFCRGKFPMCHDAVDNPWWLSWQARQRDVFFFYKQAGEWKYHCSFNMNFHFWEFGPVIDEVLALASSDADLGENNVTP